MEYGVTACRAFPHREVVGTLASLEDSEAYHPLEPPCSASHLCVISFLNTEALWHPRSHLSQALLNLHSIVYSPANIYWMDECVHTSTLQIQSTAKLVHTFEKFSVITEISTEPLQRECGRGGDSAELYSTFILHDIWYYMNIGRVTILPPPTLTSKLLSQQLVTKCLSTAVVSVTGNHARIWSCLSQAA